VETLNAKQDIRAIANHFRLLGEFVSAKPHGSGHINDTYCVTFDQHGLRTRYIFQWINHHVFKNPAALMDNVQRVTAHLATRMAHQPDAKRRVLSLVPANDGQAFYRDEEGNHWRAYVFIEGARTFDAVESPLQAFEAAKAFGHFQNMLSDLPAPRLHDTIPDFHHTPKRFAALEQAIEADVMNRAVEAKAEIAFARKRKSIVNVLLDANLPERITHNDTKFNNVMLDDKTGEGICVIDLDTVMPGLAVYDFGDIVRSATSSAGEDMRDLSKVEMQFPIFEALVKGYLTSASEFLTRAERELLASSGKLITFETGIRFLTDFLSGDTYFKVHREGHNLDRCRTQFKLTESIEEQESKMNELVIHCR
jgi:Ser/Thr protein kinase RdoA (MazF antagonist)